MKKTPGWQSPEKIRQVTKDCANSPLSPWILSQATTMIRRRWDSWLLEFSPCAMSPSSSCMYRVKKHRTRLDQFLLLTTTTGLQGRNYFESTDLTPVLKWRRTTPSSINGQMAQRSPSVTKGMGMSLIFSSARIAYAPSDMLSGRELTKHGMLCAFTCWQVSFCAAQLVGYARYLSVARVTPTVRDCWRRRGLTLRRNEDEGVRGRWRLCASWDEQRSNGLMRAWLRNNLHVSIFIRRGFHIWLILASAFVFLLVVFFLA